jgi:uncharacterized protein (TIGR02594 family)
MPSFRLTQDTPLFKASNHVSPILGIVKAGTEFQGDVQGAYIHTRVDSVAIGDGFVSVGAVVPHPTLPQPIPAERLGDFIALVTRLAWDNKTDRDFLIAVAYAGTHNLTALGGANDARIGPFQFTAKEWESATTAGPANDLGFDADDRVRWTAQCAVAARLAADAANRFNTKFNHFPAFSELYFMWLYGDGALDILAAQRTARAADLVKNPAAGSYAAQLAAGPGTVTDALNDLQGKLTAAYGVARTVIEQQPFDIRVFRSDDNEVPWLTVARNEMARKVSETPDGKNSPDIGVYLKDAALADPGANTPWCGVFVAYCLRHCGLDAVAQLVTVPDAAAAGWWLGWGVKVDTPPYTAGDVIVIKGQDGKASHVGFYVGDNGDDLKILGGNQGGGGTGPDSVSIVEFPATSILEVHSMAVPKLPTVQGLDGTKLSNAGASATPADATFIVKAPQVMRDLMRDLPGLTAIQAAGILGNIGRECAGFTKFFQVGLPPGTAGCGWCQWDGPRREAFKQWAAGQNLDWQTDQANYGYLLFELNNTEKTALRNLKQQTSLEAAVTQFEEDFERAGVVAAADRIRYGTLALTAFTG